MAAKYFYFTEPLHQNGNITNQSDAQINYLPFGLSLADTNHYRTCSLFSIPPGPSSNHPSAIAVCDGSIRAIKISQFDNDDQSKGIDSHPMWNIILKPKTPLPGHLKDVSYIIYKGILVSSLIDAGEIIDVPGLPANARRQLDALNQQSSFSNKPIETWATLHEQILRHPLHDDIVPTPTDDPEDNIWNLDQPYNPFLESLFEGKTIEVSAGQFLGGFHGFKFGIEIVVERPGQELRIDEYRSLDRTIRNYGSNPNWRDSPLPPIYIHQNNDPVLNHYDPSAFFSSLIGTKLYYQNYDGTTTRVNGSIPDRIEKLNSQVLSKTQNVGKIYLDIRNHLDKTYDYFGLYSTVEQESDPIRNFSFKQRLTDSTGAEIIGTNYRDFYHLQWPIQVFSHNELPVSSDNKYYELTLGLPVGLSLRKESEDSTYKDAGNNPTPSVYIKSGLFWARNKVTSRLQRSERSFSLFGNQTSSPLTQEITLQIPRLSSGEALSNHIKLLYFHSSSGFESLKRSKDYQELNQLGSFNQFIPATHSFDNLFPLNHWNINPYKVLPPEGKRVVKVYNSISPVLDFEGGSGAKFYHLGVAVDENFATFFGYPTHASGSKKGDFGFNKTVSTELTTNEIPFLAELTKSHPMGYFAVSTATHTKKVLDPSNGEWNDVEEQKDYLCFLERGPKEYLDERLANFISLTITKAEYDELTLAGAEGPNIFSILGIERTGQRLTDKKNFPDSYFEELSLQVHRVNANLKVEVSGENEDPPTAQPSILVRQSSIGFGRTMVSVAALPVIKNSISTYLGEVNTRFLKSPIWSDSPIFAAVINRFYILGLRRTQEEYFGSHIVFIQRVLSMFVKTKGTASEYDIAAFELSADGYLGPKTKRWIVWFQKRAFPDEPSEHDGLIGVNTIRALDYQMVINKDLINWPSFQLLHDAEVALDSGEETVIVSGNKVTLENIESYLKSDPAFTESDYINSGGSTSLPFNSPAELYQDVWDALTINGYIDDISRHLTHRIQPSSNHNSYNLNLSGKANKWQPYEFAITAAIKKRLNNENKFEKSDLITFVSPYLHLTTQDANLIMQSLKLNGYITITDGTFESPREGQITRLFVKNDPKFYIHFTHEETGENALKPKIDWSQFGSTLKEKFINNHAGTKLYGTRNSEETSYHIGIDRFLPFGTHVKVLSISQGDDKEPTIPLMDPWCYIECIDPVNYMTSAYTILQDTKLSEICFRGYVKLSTLFTEKKIKSPGAILYEIPPGIEETAEDIAKKFYQAKKFVRWRKDRKLYTNAILHVNNPEGEATVPIQAFDPTTGKFSIDTTEPANIFPKDKDGNISNISSIIFSPGFIYAVPVAVRTYSAWLDFLKSKGVNEPDPIESKTASVSPSSPPRYLWIPSISFVETLRGVVNAGEINYDLIERTQELIDDTWPIGWGISVYGELGLGIGLPKKPSSKEKSKKNGLEAQVGIKSGGEITLIRPDKDHVKMIAKGTLSASLSIGAKAKIGSFMGIGASNSLENRDPSGYLGASVEGKAGVSVSVESEFTFPIKDDNAIASIFFGILGASPAIAPASIVSRRFIECLTDLNLNPFNFLTKWTFAFEAGASLEGGLSLNLLGTESNIDNAATSNIPSFFNGEDHSNKSEDEVNQTKQVSFDVQAVAILAPHNFGFGLGISRVYKYSVERKYKKGKYAYDVDLGLRCPYEVTVTRYIDIGTKNGPSGGYAYLLNGMIDYRRIGESGAGYEISTTTIHATDTGLETYSSYFNQPIHKDPEITNFTRLTNKNQADQLLFESIIGIKLKHDVALTNHTQFKQSILGFKFEKALDLLSMNFKFSDYLDSIISIPEDAKSYASFSQSSILFIRLEADLSQQEDLKNFIYKIIDDEFTPPNGLNTLSRKEYYEQAQAALYSNLLSTYPSVSGPNEVDKWKKYRKEFISFLKLNPNNGVEYNFSVGLSAGIDGIPITPALKLDFKLGGSILYKLEYANMTEEQKKNIDPLFAPIQSDEQGGEGNHQKSRFKEALINFVVPVSEFFALSQKLQQS